MLYVNLVNAVYVDIKGIEPIFGVNQRLPGFEDLTVLDIDDSDLTNACAICVCRFNVYCVKCQQVLSLRVDHFQKPRLDKHLNAEFPSLGKFAARLRAGHKVVGILRDIAHDATARRMNKSSR